VSTPELGTLFILVTGGASCLRPQFSSTLMVDAQDLWTLGRCPGLSQSFFPSPPR
jgi:hypothetical protein